VPRAIRDNRLRFAIASFSRHRQRQRQQNPTATARNPAVPSIYACTTPAEPAHPSHAPWTSSSRLSPRRWPRARRSLTHSATRSTSTPPSGPSATAHDGYVPTTQPCCSPCKHSLEDCLTSEPQEDGSNCSIFSFDISANRSALPLARNALKKLRTLRHPGVIKVLDTVEVRRPTATEEPAETDVFKKVRFVHLHRDRARGPSPVARQTKEPKPRDNEVGSLQHRGASEEYKADVARPDTY